MWLNTQHAELDIPTLHQFIRDHPLGVLTTAIPSASHPLLQSSHIPWVLDIPDSNGDEPSTTNSNSSLGYLRGHLARQNPQAKAMIESLTSNRLQPQTQFLKEDVMILFTSPAHHYITPKFYTTTKPTTGKVVPTWDYAAVQVYGKANIYFDRQSDDFLSQQMVNLTGHAERMMGFGGQDAPPPWEVSDAPDRYISLLKKSLVGVEIEITSIAGKFKMSQEKPGGDRDGVIRGLQGLGTAQAGQTAEWVKEQAVRYDVRKQS